MAYGDKAIPTMYKGIRFKSMIEARYAQTFDDLGLKWEYEPNNFMLTNGLNYMPDFRFTGTNTYFEVKGVNSFSEIPQKDDWKLWGFREDFPNVFLLVGINTGEFAQPIGIDNTVEIMNENKDFPDVIGVKNYWKYTKYANDPKAHYLGDGKVYFDWGTVNAGVLIKCGNCDTPYFVNPWGTVKFGRQTLCPHCGAMCFCCVDEGDYKINRNAIYEIMWPKNLFDGEFIWTCYYDLIGQEVK